MPNLNLKYKHFVKNWMKIIKQTDENDISDGRFIFRTLMNDIDDGFDMIDEDPDDEPYEDDG